MLLARAQGELPRPGRRARALGAHRAGRAIGRGELDLVERVVVARRLGPRAARLAAGAGHRAPLPVDREAGHVEALRGGGLPARVEKRWAEQLDAPLGTGA